VWWDQSSSLLQLSGTSECSKKPVSCRCWPAALNRWLEIGKYIQNNFKVKLQPAVGANSNCLLLENLPMVERPKIAARPREIIKTKQSDFLVPKK
jgi:hypothetical protein